MSREIAIAKKLREVQIITHEFLEKFSAPDFSL